MHKCQLRDKRVQILLSTYNGEKYLRDQLNSFLSQEEIQISVLVRDDGSTDDTRAILDEYSQKYGFKVILGENIGVNASMQLLIEVADESCDYYALSDQDDVWKPWKLAREIQFLEVQPQSLPLLAATASCITDEQLHPRGRTIISKRPPSFYNAMIQNICPGHTQVFNQKLLKLLSQSDSKSANVFDWWVYLLASGLGKVIISPESSVLHRQHENNAVGYQVNPLRRFLLRLQRLIRGESSLLTMQLKGFYSLYGNMLPLEYRQEIMDFFNCRSIRERIKYAIKMKVYRHSLWETMVFRLLFILGKYRVKEF